MKILARRASTRRTSRSWIHGSGEQTVESSLSSDYAVTSFRTHLKALIDEHQYTEICEIGGGREPLFEPKDVAALRLRYTVLDVSPTELAMAPEAYIKVCADVCDPILRGQPRYDLVFSRFVAEHVKSGREMHRNIFSMLKPNGRAFHLFPTLFSPAFVLNRLVPHRIGHILKDVLVPSDRHMVSFPARYSKCYGPTPRMQAFLTQLGYEIEQYRPFYGTGYFRNMPIARALDRRLTAWAASSRNPYLTSYVYLVLVKP